MIEVHDLFETHVTVADLDRSIDFYRGVVGLQLAHVVEGRAAFFWVGPVGRSMLGVWAGGSGPQRMTLHTAFRATVADVVAAPRALRLSGVIPLDFDLRPTNEPVVIAWMPAVSIYFRDPDSHLLEFIAMLPHEPQPEQGIVPWHVWALAHGVDVSAEEND
jgi:lactoylglutathione lyase